MKDQLINFLESIGLFYKDDDKFKLPYDLSAYKGGDKVEKLKTHRDFLQTLNDKEDSRLESIDGKTSQMISQTGIIFSLLGVFIPIFLDKASSFHIAIKVTLLFILILACFCHILTIHNALRNYKINKFEYANPGPANVLDLKDESEETFLAEEVRDLLFSHAKNQWNNNRRGTNLLHAFHSFKAANILTGFLVIIFSVSMFFYSKEKDTISIESPVQINGLDTLLRKLDELKGRKDTLFMVTQPPPTMGNGVTDTTRR